MRFSSYQWFPVALGFALFVAALSPYCQTTDFDFVNLDDLGYVKGNPNMLGGLTLSNIGWAFTSIKYAGCWMPLTWLSFMTDVSLFGMKPGPIHVVNAVYHACNTVLLFALLAVLLARCKWTPDERAIQPGVLLASALTALFWALHPLRVEPVAWIASRKDVLSLFWELIALILWVVHVTVPHAEARSRPARVRVILCFLSFAFALMAKPTAMTFPVLAALLEFLLTRRIVWKRLMDFVLVAFLAALLSAAAQTAGGATQPLAHVPFHGRLFNAIAALGTYARDTVWPVQLAVPYPHRWPEFPDFFFPALTVCFAFCLIAFFVVIRLVRSGEFTLLLSSIRIPWVQSVLRSFHPGSMSQDPSRAWLPRHQGDVFFLVSLLWVLVAIAPMLGFANFGYHSHADRFTYLPAIGLSLWFAFVLVVFIHRFPYTGPMLGPACLLVIVTLMAQQSVIQVGFWKNGATLFPHTLAVTGENVIAHRCLAICKFREHTDLSGAIYHMGRAIEMGGREVLFCHHAMYVLMLAEAGRFSEAESHARFLNEIDDDGTRKDKVVSSLLAYCAIALYKNDLESAHQHLSRLFQMAPQLEDAHYLAGLLAMKESRFADAERAWRFVYEKDWRFGFLESRLSHLASSRR